MLTLGSEARVAGAGHDWSLQTVLFSFLFVAGQDAGRGTREACAGLQKYAEVISAFRWLWLQTTGRL